MLRARSALSAPEPPRCNTCLAAVSLSTVHAPSSMAMRACRDASYGAAMTTSPFDADPKTTCGRNGDQSVVIALGQLGLKQCRVRGSADRSLHAGSATCSHESRMQSGPSQLAQRRIWSVSSSASRLCPHRRRRIDRSPGSTAGPLAATSITRLFKGDVEAPDLLQVTTALTYTAVACRFRLSLTICDSLSTLRQRIASK